MIGFTAIGTVIMFGILRKLGFYLEEVAGDIIPNILTISVFSGLIYWAIGSVFIASERNKMRESYILYDESSITYHMLREAYTRISYLLYNNY